MRGDLDLPSFQTIGIGHSRKYFGGRFSRRVQVSGFGVQIEI